MSPAELVSSLAGTTPAPGQRDEITPNLGLVWELPVSKRSESVREASTGTSAPTRSFPMPGKRKPGALASLMWINT